VIPAELRIVSGGQTGVDRAALDAALAAGVPCGGWCPDGRMAEDGVIDMRYPLTEMPGGGYIERTRANVVDSDGTLILHAGTLEGGTLMTQNFCTEFDKPSLIVSSKAFDAATASAAARVFVTQNGIRTLNIAGPRASKQPQIHDWAYAVVAGLLRLKAVPS
jgi:predicted Rossmann fold nucleotide-binding protein DprA/Smf involved in DNA uptake